MATKAASPAPKQPKDDSAKLFEDFKKLGDVFEDQVRRLSVKQLVSVHEDKIKKSVAVQTASKKTHEEMEELLKQVKKLVVQYEAAQKAGKADAKTLDEVRALNAELKKKSKELGALLGDKEKEKTAATKKRKRKRKIKRSCCVSFSLFFGGSTGFGFLDTTNFLCPILSLFSLFSSHFHSLNQALSDESVFWFEFLGESDVVVDESKTRGTTASECSFKTVQKNRSDVSNLVHLCQLFSQLNFWHI